MLHNSNLYEASKIVKLKEAKNRSIVARAEGEGNGGLLIYGYEISVMQDEKVLEICYTTLCP